MFEAANMSEFRRLGLDAPVPSQTLRAQEQAKPSLPEPTPEEVAVSPRYWLCFWLGGDD